MNNLILQLEKDDIILVENYEQDEKKQNEEAEKKNKRIKENVQWIKYCKNRLDKKPRISFSGDQKN